MGKMFEPLAAVKAEWRFDREQEAAAEQRQKDYDRAAAASVRPAVLDLAWQDEPDLFEETRQPIDGDRVSGFRALLEIYAAVLRGDYERADVIARDLQAQIVKVGCERWTVAEAIETALSKVQK